MTQSAIKKNSPQEWNKTDLGRIIYPSKERFNPVTNKNRTFIGLEHIESNTGCILEPGKSRETESTKTVFHAGDVLYGRLRPYLNKVCVPSFDGVCSTDILVFSENKFISSKYLALVLSTPDFVAYANKNSAGVQHPRISFKKLAQFQIHLPPFSEQQKIAANVEYAFGKINTTKRLLEKSLSLLEQQRQSILNSTFNANMSVRNRIDGQ